jgi:crotonobetainyl-CoA:carnitine CoA-transferase CaiB-like acyl-CoA transferase
LAAQGPLERIRVLDLSSYIAGAYAGMMLADLGADVVKVESLDGDSFRELPGFYGWNRGKRSIAVNLKEGAGREIVHRLARRADVALENMRPGVTARLEIDYDRLRAVNPRIVYCSVTAFGPDGPYRERPGFDPLLQAMGGVMELQGWGGDPQYLRIPIVDYYAAALACQGALAGLFARERTGRGQKVETSLLDAVLALQSGNVADYPGKEIVYRENPTYRLYRASDGGWFFLACGNQSFWAKLCAALERPDLATDPRFGSFLLRRDNADALVPVLEAAFGSKPCAEWLSILAAHDIPCAAVQTLSALMSDPAVTGQGRRVDYIHPAVGALRMMGLPLRCSETQGEAGVRPPLLGEHGVEILEELGYSSGDIDGLRRRRIVG